MPKPQRDVWLTFLWSTLHRETTLFRWLRIAGNSTTRAFRQLTEAGVALIARATLSDAIGYLLILTALVAILLRLRWRLMHAPSLTRIECPECGGEIHRVHRRTRDYLISLFMPVRRYSCSNSECRWRGIRLVPGSSRPSQSSARDRK